MSRPWLHVWALLVWAVLPTLSARARAQPSEPFSEIVPSGPGIEQPSPPPVTALDAGSEDPRAVLAASLLTRAARIRQLIAGTLDPTVDADALFSVQLDALGGDADRLQALVAAIESGRAEPPSDEAPRSEGPAAVPPPEPPSHPPDSEPDPSPPPSTPPEDPETGLDEARATLASAYAAFFSLSPERATQRLRAHRARVQEHQAQVGAQARVQEALAGTLGQAEALEAFLRGELEPEIDPAELLAVDLLQDRELLGSEHRRASVLGTGEPVHAGVGEGQASPPGPDEVALREAERRVDRARLAYLALPSEARQALFATHDAVDREAEPPPPEVAEIPDTFVDDEARQDEEEISDAEEEAADAAREKEEALEVARLARTEVLRVIAERRAHLLGIKEQQALFAASLPRWKQDARELHEAALEWHRRVDELMESAVDADRFEAADAMYGSTRQALDESRRALADALERISAPGAKVPRPAEETEADEDLDDADRGELKPLLAELRSEAQLLQSEETEVGWEVAEMLRDDIVVLNRDRLRLLSRTSATLRTDVTGLGSRGREQGRRELRQIALELRYHAMSLPRDAESLLEHVQRRPVDFVLRTLELLVLIAVFRGWRRRADALLLRWQTPSRGFSRTRSERWRSRAFWYLRRIRRPVEWLLLLGILPLILGTGPDMPELRLPWLALVWILGGRAVVLTIDAIADRQASYAFGARGNGDLRYRSLRMIGITVTSIGLILSVTSDIVGRGAIYRWVIQGCWILVAPIGLWLVSQWRPITFERIAALPRSNGLTRWVAANTAGPVGFAAATVGGIYLLLHGTFNWLMRQLSSLDTTRKVLAYLFRREVAKRAETAALRPRGQPISGAVFDRLGPQSAGTTAKLLEGPARALVDEAVELARTEASTLSAVVGERGAGKTTFLKRVIERSEDTTCIVGCPPEGFDALLEALAVQFDASDYEPHTVASAIRGAGAAVICVDDAHRMIAPAVGGLEQLDRFTRFALEVGGDVSWIVAVQRAAWHFVGRARGDRVFFDQVLTLPRWSEEDIAELIHVRSEAAGIEPSFEELVVATDGAEGPTEGRRTELGYYRILWDHSGGNPAVALQAWRQSLFLRPDEERPVVRLFVEPSATEIERLPQTLLFVLRAIVQLELATAEEIADCTQLPVADVADAIRFSVAHGYAESRAGRFRLSWAWYRTITTVLTRQHLLVA